MWTLSQIVCLVFLVGMSVVDIRCHKVPVNVLIAGTVCAVLYQIFQMCSAEIELWQVAGGAGIGVVFLLVSRVTREGIGYGDSWGILSLGIYLGFLKLIEVLAGALFLLVIISIVMLSIKKMSRKFALAFYPFLTAGYVMGVMNIWQ